MESQGRLKFFTISVIHHNQLHYHSRTETGSHVFIQDKQNSDYSGFTARIWTSISYSTYYHNSSPAAYCLVVSKRTVHMRYEVGTE